MLINTQGKTAWVIPASGKGKKICETEFAQAPGSTYKVMQGDREVLCIPYGDCILGEGSQKIKLHVVYCNITLFTVSFMVMCPSLGTSQHLLSPFRILGSEPDSHSIAISRVLQ